MPCRIDWFDPCTDDPRDGSHILVRRQAESSEQRLDSKSQISNAYSHKRRLTIRDRSGIGVANWDPLAMSHARWALSDAHREGIFAIRK